MRQRGAYSRIGIEETKLAGMNDATIKAKTGALKELLA
jgi:hypothetical protein